MQPLMIAEPQFDTVANSYDSMLNQGLSVSGEDKDYFAERRIAWLAQCLKVRGVKTNCVLDFGCGTGTATPFLFTDLGAESVIGVDVSTASLDVARIAYAELQTQFITPEALSSIANVDVAYSNGVFHHIAPELRGEAVASVYRALAPSGYFALWENNPWNPGTRYVMSRIPFDRDAITLTANETRTLLRAAGFEIVCTNFLFVFPRALAWLRAIEPALTRLPLGAQYMVLARKPAR